MLDSVHPTSLVITGLKLEQRKTGYTDTIRRDLTYNLKKKKQQQLFFKKNSFKKTFFHGGIYVLLDEWVLFTVKTFRIKLNLAKQEE